MNRVIVGLGSNIDPENNIEQAKIILRQRYRILAESSLLQTKPIGPQPQPDFLNGAVLLITEETPMRLKAELKTIEKRLGRPKESDPYTPRVIDLDILVWNQTIVDEDVYTRDFLRVSINECMPKFEME